MDKKKIKNLLLDALCFTVGSLFYAISVNTFTAPNQIAAGGVTGISTLLNHLFGLPIGTMNLIFNVPLFLWGFYEMGFVFLAKTGVAMLMTSLMIDFTASFLPVYTGNFLLITVVGGVFAGVGLGLIFIRGTTTGGTDLAANLLHRRLRHISLGKILLFIDFLVVLASAFVFGNIESPFYAVIVIFVCTKVIDTVLYGTDVGTGKMMFIMSPKADEISKKIIVDLDRGVTALKSRGCYSNRDGETLLCAVRRQEVHKIYDMVHSIDPDAFMMVGEAGEIRGEGFKEMVHNSRKSKKLKKQN